MRDCYHGREAGMRRLPWQRPPHHLRLRNVTGGEPQQRNNEKTKVISQIGNVIFLVFEVDRRELCTSIIPMYMHFHFYLAFKHVSFPLYHQHIYLPGLPRKTEEYRTPLLVSPATRASGGDDHSRLGHHLPATIKNIT